MLNIDLIDDAKWNEYLNYKLNKSSVNVSYKKVLESFILKKKYINIAKQIVEGTYVFSDSKKHIISKNASSKKRVVYNFNNDEMIILKFISYLLYDYDYLFSKNLYSFRCSRGVKSAINSISKIKNINNMYGYKTDIKNYFNSIDTDVLLKRLCVDIDDSVLIDVFKQLLSNKKTIFNNCLIFEDKGAMAGVPLSAFLANYYLKNMDEYFWNEKLVYFRYADDCIIFCNTKEEIIKYSNKLKEILKENKLEINPKKEYFFNPRDKWEFLGFSFENGEIDLSENSVKKIKGKIKRSARGIRRWMLKKDAKYEYALKAMNRKYNRKFYGNDITSELSWKFWFFPTITTVKSLKIVDNYMQEYLRYIVTGKHNKRNYKKVPYSKLKACNYRSLVNEYYKQE